MEKLERANREELIEVILGQQVQLAVLLEQVESLQGRVGELEEEVRRLRQGGRQGGVEHEAEPAAQVEEGSQAPGSIFREASGETR